MQSFQNFEDILKRLRETAPDQNDLDMRSKLQTDLDAPMAPEEGLDFLKDSAPRSKVVVPAEKVNSGIDSGKIKSFVPEDLNNPSDKFNSVTPETADLKKQFSNPESIGGEFSPLNKEQAISKQGSLFDHVNPPVEDLSKYNSIKQDQPILEKLASLPEETLMKMRMTNPGSALSNLAEMAAKSKIGTAVGGVFKAASPTADALYTGDKYKAGLQSSGNLIDDVQDDNKSKLQTITDAMKMAGHSTAAAGGLMSMAPGGASLGIPAMVAGESVNMLAEAPQALENSRKSFEDPKNIQAIKELGAGMAAPKSETITTPPVVPPMQQAQNPASLPNQMAGPPWNAPAGLMNNKEASDASSNSPVEQNIQQQTQPSESKSPYQKLLDAHRSIASEQGTGLRDAQRLSNENEFYANLMKGVNQFNSGITGSSVTGPVKVDNSTLDALAKTANNPTIQYKEQVADQKNDPTSRYSKIMQDFVKAKMPEVQGVDAASGSDLETMLKYGIPLKKAEEMHTYNQHVQDIKMGAKAGDNQNKVFDKTKSLLESARGNPAAAQAERDLYAADKAKSLANLYGDPNKLNPAMVQLLASELGKIASGGVPTMHELEGLTPQTLKSKFAGIWEKVTSNPTPANVGSFVKQYMDYSNALTKDAQKVIRNKYGRIIESSKNELGEKNYKSLQEQYINRFENEEEQDNSSKSKNTKSISKDELNAYAKQYNKTPEEAAKMLFNAGYQLQ